MADQWYYRMDSEGETPMSRAVKSGHLALTELMLRQRDQDEPDTAAGESLLQRAAYWGLDNAVRKLLDSGADPSERDKLGETPLHKAGRRGHLDAVLALIERGADVNAVNEMGMTTLHWVALNGRADVARVLVEHGAEINQRDENVGGLTPLALAKLMGYENLAGFLGEHGGSW